MRITNLSKVAAGICLLITVGACEKREPIPPSVTESVGSATSVPTTDSGTHTPAPLVLVSLTPAKTSAGVGFNVQPNGDSAIGMKAENYTRATVIVIDGENLPTTYGDAFLSAFVPTRFTAKPGTHIVQLVDGERRSNSLEFVVE